MEGRGRWTVESCLFSLYIGHSLAESHSRARKPHATCARVCASARLYRIVTHQWLGIQGRTCLYRASRERERERQPLDSCSRASLPHTTPYITTYTYNRATETTVRPWNTTSHTSPHTKQLYTETTVICPWNT